MGLNSDDKKKLLQDAPAQDYGTLVDISEIKSKAKKEESVNASIFHLFIYTTRSDRILITFGTIFAILSGSAMPILGLFFGGMTNTFLSVTINGLLPDPVVNSTEAAPNLASTPLSLNFINNSPTAFEEQKIGRVLFNMYYTIVETFKAEDPYSKMAQNDTFTIPITESEFERSLNRYAIIYIVIGVLMLTFSFLQTLCWEYTSEHQVHTIRQVYFKQILRQDISWYDTNDNGNLPNKLADDVERIRDGSGYKCVVIVQYVSTFISGILVGLSVNWQLTLVILCVAPLLATLSAYTFRFGATSAAREQEKYAAAGAVAEEVLSNIKTVSAFGGEPAEIKRYDYWLEEGRRQAMKKYNTLAVSLGFTFFLMYAVYGLAFAYGSYLVQIGITSPGSIFTVFFSVVMGSAAIGQSLPFLNAVSGTIGVIASVHGIINRKVVIDPYSPAGHQPTCISGRIEFKNASFAYPTRPHNLVLNGLNLIIEPGKRVAIVGSSGAGKSTIVGLILRYYDTTAGEVYLDGVSVKNYNVHWLRSQIGLVSQEPVLFGVSIAENIKYGSETATAEEIIEAAKQANAHDFIIRLPEGYETLVGDTGSQLSGGQKQRIAIARALVRDPKILLLDEATSALDAKSEGIVQDTLENAMKGRTTIIVAHRLSTVRHADTICVMQNGKLIESGTHAELIAKRTVYYELVQAQIAKKKDTSPDSSPRSSTAALSRITESEEKEDDIIYTETAEESVASGAVGEAHRSQEMIIQAHESEGQDDRTTEPEHEKETKENLSADENTQQSSIARQNLGDAVDLIGMEQLNVNENRPYRRRRGSSINEITEEERKNIYFLKPEKIEKEISFIQLIKMQSPEMLWLLIGIIGYMIYGFVTPAFALYYGEMFKVFTLTGDALSNASIFWTYMFVALALVSGLSGSTQVKGLTHSNEKLIARARSLVFENILKQPVGWFDLDTSSPGILVNRLARNAPLVKAAAGMRAGQVLSAAVTLVSAFAIAFICGWKLASVLAIAVPVIIFTSVKQQKLLNRNINRDTKLMDTAGRVASETVRNIRTVQALGQERRFTEIYIENLEMPYKEGKKQALIYAILYSSTQGIMYLMYAVAFRLGGYLLEIEEMTAAEIYKVFFALSLCANSVGFMFSYIQDYAKARYSIKLLNYLLTRKSEIDSSSTTGARPEVFGNVEFKNVHFAYSTRPDIKVLKGLSFRVDAGKTLALVGESGCGKSTVMSLLERFYDPMSGVITVDNYDTRTVNLSHLRSKMGIVTQEPILFDNTIRENIAYGALALMPEVPFELVKQAAQTANIHDFIMTLPDRYDTVVGERGVQLSGGQKQRVAIARALIRDPKILLLDEATSALDTESEKIVQAALDDAKKGRTCIIVAHRLSTIQNADTICVVHRGKIVETGTHDELQALKGQYFQLTERQSLS